MKKVIMFIFLAFAISGCGDISLDSDRGGNSSNINSGSDSSSDGNGSDSSGSEVVKFDCYTIYDLDVGCDAVPSSNTVEINEYNWDFGDSSAAYSGKYTAQFVTHRYRRSGKYNINLNVKYTDSGIQKTLSYSKPIDVKQTSLPLVFANRFGDEEDKMYYALHITGCSQINSVTKTGLFAQKGNDGFGDGSYKEDFARDLYYQLSSGGAHLKFSESHRAVGVSDFYSNEYGFTDSDGLVFDMPFYFGYDAFNIPINSNGKVSFVSFALEDGTKPSWGGYAYPVFVRCNNNMFNFQIPMNEYNADRHKNIALFTVKFTGICDYTVEFNGFLNK